MAVCAAFCLASACAQTGVAVPELEEFDRLLPEFLSRWHIQGGSIAVSKDGRLVFARGYGWANVEAQRPVVPQSLFRIASISKTFTAMGVMKLVEQDRLDLEARAFRLLNHLQPPPGAVPDPRLYGITVQQLLHHTAGFDKDKGGVTDGNDPMLPPMAEQAATVLGASRPASPGTIIRFMIGTAARLRPRHALRLLGLRIQRAREDHRESQRAELRRLHRREHFAPGGSHAHAVGAQPPFRSRARRSALLLGSTDI